jgi:hypothetical protein
MKMDSGKSLEAASAGGGPAGDDGASADLEAGIAAVFARLREAVDSDGAGLARDAADAATVDDGTTFDLLGELDRLWRGDA